MAMNFGTCATGQPKRGLPRTAGSLAGSALRMRARHRAELLGADVGHYAARVSSRGEPCLADCVYRGVTAVPEPENYALMLAGLACVPLLRRTRRAQQVEGA